MLPPIGSRMISRNWILRVRLIRHLSGMHGLGINLLMGNLLLMGKYSSKGIYVCGCGGGGAFRLSCSLQCVLA